VPGNSVTVGAFWEHVQRLWFRALRRRGQRTRMTWKRLQRLVKRWLPTPRVLHPYPSERFDARYPRQEPSAVVPLAGI
jgi:RNA-directed DNA polymerase